MAFLVGRIRRSFLFVRCVFPVFFLLSVYHPCTPLATDKKWRDDFSRPIRRKDPLFENLLPYFAAE
jgi:hypothetical protein